jgi:hypothetical protein
MDQKRGPLGKDEGRVVNAFETWSWRGMLKIKWTCRITNDEVFKGQNKRYYFYKMDVIHGQGIQLGVTSL